MLQEVVVIIISTIIIVFSSLGVLYFVVNRKLGDTIEGFAEVIGAMFEKPAVSKAMSVLGKKSAEVRGNRAMMDRIAGDVLNNPQFAAIKFGAKALGLDVDALIEEYGAVETLQGVKGLGDQLGIDILSLAGKGLNLTTKSSSNAENPYLG